MAQQDIEVKGANAPAPSMTTTPHPSSPTSPTSRHTAPQQPNPAQKSWVWSHFKLNNNINKLQCLAPDKKKGGNSCGILLTRDATGSTKSMSEHLKRVHHILPPGQEKTNQLLLPNLLKRKRVEHCVRTIIKLTFLFLSF